MKELGTQMMNYSVVLYGRRDRRLWHAFIDGIVTVIRMEKAGAAKEWDYPLDGKGGNGFTLVQPITESFIALDVWPDHDGSYLVICSCRPFDPLPLENYFRTCGFDSISSKIVQQEIVKELVA